MTSGIYGLHQISKDRAIYVGSSGNIAQRWRQHRNVLKKKTTHNKYLQRVWDKYGADDFQFRVLEECSIESLIEREQFWANALKPICNVGEFVESPIRGQKLSDEHRAKLSAARKGRKFGPRSEEALANMRAGQRGKIVSPEQIEKMAAVNRGRKITEEHRRKLSNANKGNQRAKNPTDEVRKKISEAQKKRFANPNAISEETRRKLSIAAQEFWARRRFQKKGK